MSDERAHDDPEKILKNSTDSQLPIDIAPLSQFEIQNDNCWLVIPRELRQAYRQKDMFDEHTSRSP